MQRKVERSVMFQKSGRSTAPVTAIGQEFFRTGFLHPNLVVLRLYFWVKNDYIFGLPTTQ